MEYAGYLQWPLLCRTLTLPDTDNRPGWPCLQLNLLPGNAHHAEQGISGDKLPVQSAVNKTIFFFNMRNACGVSRVPFLASEFLCQQMVSL